MLTSKETKNFKKQANRMKDHLVIGHSGINTARVKEITALFESQSCLKISVNKSTEKTKEEIIKELQQHFDKSAILLSGTKFLLIR